MIDILIYGIMVLFGCFYALALDCLERWLRVVSKATWLTVLVGVAATLGLVGLVGRADWI